MLAEVAVQAVATVAVDACAVEAVHSEPAKRRTVLHDGGAGVVAACEKSIADETSRRFGVVAQRIPSHGSSVRLDQQVVPADAPFGRLDPCAPEEPFPSGLLRNRQAQANG